MLSTYGIQAQTPHQVEPVQIWPPGEMIKVFESLGRNEKLKVSGRPSRPIGALGTSKVSNSLDKLSDRNEIVCVFQFCRVFGDTVLCYPLLFDMTDFYISADPAILIEDIKVYDLLVRRRDCGPASSFSERPDVHFATLATFWSPYILHHPAGRACHRRTFCEDDGLIGSHESRILR